MTDEGATVNTDLVGRLELLVAEGCLSEGDVELLKIALANSLPKKSRFDLTELPKSFLEKFEIQEDTGCWEWLAGKTKPGYGRFRWGGSEQAGGRVHYAHRFAYEVLRGESPEGGFIDHLCENKSCVNPDHLEAVSPEENFSRIYNRDNVGGMTSDSPSAALRERTQAPCCASGCEKQTYAKELCRSHYDAARRAKKRRLARVAAITQSVGVSG